MNSLKEEDNKIKIEVKTEAAPSATDISNYGGWFMISVWLGDEKWKINCYYTCFSYGDQGKAFSKTVKNISGMICLWNFLRGAIHDLYPTHPIFCPENGQIPGNLSVVGGRNLMCLHYLSG